MVFSPNWKYNFCINQTTIMKLRQTNYEIALSFNIKLFPFWPEPPIALVIRRVIFCYEYLIENL